MMNDQSEERPYDPGTFTNNANSFMACVSFAV